MRTRAPIFLVAAALTCLIAAAGHAQVTSYSQDFELMDQADPAALSADGWLVFGNVFDTDGTTYLYGYGPFPAPNHAAAFSAIAFGEGGIDQGLQQVTIFSDYENVAHAAGQWVESNFYREWTVTADNVGQTWAFRFQGKRGNLEGSSTAAAFIKTLNPAAGWALTNFITQDMTTAPTTWMGYTLAIDIDASLVGQVFQIGFMNTATLYEGSGVFYDNIIFQPGPTATPPSTSVLGATLKQNYPNPFNPTTRIEFSLERPGMVELTVFDVAGRRVATLQRGEMESGPHSISWDGRSDDGARVASGQYHYVLKTADVELSRSMTLVK